MKENGFQVFLMWWIQLYFDVVDPIIKLFLLLV